jgi:hypothetical protein
MYHIEFLMSKLVVHKVITGLEKVNVNYWMPPYADKPLRDCSQNSRTFGNMALRKTPGSALWSVAKKYFVIETERLLNKKFSYKKRSHDMWG